MISITSRSLPDAEKHHKQMEKKALAIVWACEQFNMSIFGKEFELETDH